MIKHLNNYEIDKAKWDNCIEKSFNGIIYAYSWYLDIVSPEWEALIEEDYSIVFPLTQRSKNGINYLFQPVFTQQLGVFSIKKLNSEIVQQFLKHIPQKYKFIDINLNTFNQIDNSEIQAQRFVTYELDLIHSYEFIYKHYANNTKRNIKKAQNEKIQLMSNLKPEVIIDLFRKNKGKDLNNLKDKDYQILTKLIYKCLQKGRAYLIGAYNTNNELCAGTIFIESHKKIIFLFSATNELAKENGAMFYLIDKFIFENSQKNLTLDFEGSNISSLARFYRGFGSTECIYLHLEINKLNFIYNFLLKAKRNLINKFQKNG